jgi:putative membrane protein
MRATILTGVMTASACLLFASASARAQGVTDPQIASIVVTANQVDIDAGKLAKSKASNAEVKAFAEQMITDHTGVNKQATELVTKLNVKPEDNSTSKALKEGGDKNLATLKGLSGAAFDKAYIDHEVAYHQAVLDAVDKTLIPGAKNEELKALLVKVRPAFEAHLEHARKVQQSVGKTVSMDGTRFQPQSLTVKAGDSVVWVNNDPFPHTATSKAAGFDSQPIAPGGSYTYVASKKGQFAYACTLHPTMTATLTVE